MQRVYFGVQSQFYPFVYVLEKAGMNPSIKNMFGY